MEQKINVWDLLTESTNKQETLLKIAACLETPVRDILSHLSLTRVDAVFETFEVGKPHVFSMPAGFLDAFSIGGADQNVVHSLSSDKQKILVADFEVMARVPLNKNTANDLGMLLAKEMANIEDTYYRDLRTAVYKENGVCSNSCLMSVIQPVTIIPAEDADNGTITLVAFELLNMCLPFNVDKK